MNIYYGFENLEHIKNPVVTTGTFDGVHFGHQCIIDSINNIAKTINGESVLITFHPHPRKILYPETAGKNLFLIKSQSEKIEQLRKAGLQNLIISNFTKEFSEISSIDFIRKILVEKLHVKCVVIGFNHHFGHNREGNYDYLYELGQYYNFKVKEIPEQDIQNETVSSTKIRGALLEGNIQRANAYLDHIYNIIGPLVNVSDDYLKLNIETQQIEIDEECKLLPPDGIYAAKLLTDDNQYKALFVRSKIVENIQNFKKYVHVLFIDKSDNETSEKNIELLLYKKLYDLDNLKTTESLTNLIEKNILEADELIY